MSEHLQDDGIGDPAVMRLDDPATLQARWRPVWERLDPFRADTGAAQRPRSYILDMFPYPSGDLHMGHAEAFVIGDIAARYRWLRGDNVLHPIGWDSFGLPAENAAIQRNSHPADWTYANIDTQAESFRRYAIAFDWSRRLHTSDPEYYRWTQWLFLRMREKGLAYRKASPVNWCPKDQTVLANEQVVNGACERCGTFVTKRNLTQWYFRITNYADRLLDDMEELKGRWPERVLTMQRNWIGRSAGATLRFAVEGCEEALAAYTTRPDTTYGATFLIVAADSEVAVEFCSDEQRPALDAYRESIRSASEIERLATDRPKTGVFLGRHAINPINGARLPVWASDYVLAEYGTGVVMAVPAHDQRDLDFARAMSLPVKVVVDTEEGDPAETGIAITSAGTLINSGALTGMQKDDATASIIRQLESAGTGEGAVNFRLRDWLVSRQRFWGTPIPIIHCPSCGEVPVPDEQLPVRLPDLRGADLAPKGISPLAAASDWVNVDCPDCGGAATRDSDTMDTFVDSSWYYLRYCSPHNDAAPFNPVDVRAWMPVAQYVGGVEHAILHLLYSRFVTKFFNDLGLIDFDEPFQALLNQGQVINDGKAMSKSLGNGVDLGEQIDKFGVDAVRLTMVFAGPPAEDIDWADLSPSGSAKFLARALRLADGVTSPRGVDVSQGNRAVRAVFHRLFGEITDAIENHRYNVAVARLMELVNAIRKALPASSGSSDPAVREATEALAVMLSVVAPYTAEEIWHRLGHAATVARAAWPTVDSSLLVQDSVTCIVQVDGKVRARLTVHPDVSEEQLRDAALDATSVINSIAGRAVQRTIVRAPRLVNVVTA